MSSFTPLPAALARKALPLASGPFSSTGMVTETFRLGLALQDWPSSTPPAPPNETITLAPAAWARAIRGLTVELSMPKVSPQIGVQPEPITKAAV
jgi:hypothetical protein